MLPSLKKATGSVPEEEEEEEEEEARTNFDGNLMATRSRGRRPKRSRTVEPEGVAVNIFAAPTKGSSMLIL